MTSTLLSCWESSLNHEPLFSIYGILTVRPFSGFQLEVGFNPPFHSIRGPLDRSGPCGAEQPTFSTHEERSPIILVMLYAGQSKTEGVVTGWMEVNQTNANSVEDIQVTRAKCNEEPRTVRAETGLH